MVWWGEANPAFFDPRGGTHFDGRWKPPELPERPVEALLEQNRRSGGVPGPPAFGERCPWTAGARWEREADIPDEIYLRAVDAIA